MKLNIAEIDSEIFRLKIIKETRSRMIEKYQNDFSKAVICLALTAITLI
jgi:hypothetical protein